MLTRMTTTDDYLSLPINKLVKWSKKNGFYYGVLTFSRGEEKIGSIRCCLNLSDLSIRLIYIHTENYSEEKTELDYEIRLTTTKCNLGGVRYWFVCPLSVNGVYCGRRCGVLYGGKYFGCRKCYNLKYQSQADSNRNKSGYFSALNKIFDREDQYEKIDKLKRWWYRGKPNKKYAKLLRKISTIERNVSIYYDALNKQKQKIRKLKNNP